MAEDGSMNCNFFLYFPSSKPDKWTDFRNIVPRTYAYHGETVRFLLVSQYDGNSDNQQCLQSWHDRMQTLCMSANAGFYHEVGNIVTNTNIDALAISGKDEHGFKKCEPLSEYCKTSEISANELAKPIMIGGDTIIFPLSVTLDRLPVKMNSVDISVSLWTPEYNDKALKLHGYLKLFVESDPMAILKAASSGIQCNVNATMSLLSPPCVGCRHISVAGKQYVLVKVSNDFKDVLVLHNLKVLPNSNDNFLPPSPDGAHKNNFINKERVSKYLDVNSISMVTSRSCQLPITLKPLEKHCVVFRVHIRNYANHENTESFEVPLLLALSWSTSSQLNSEVIITHYKLPRIKINLPSLVMSASCDSPITVGKSFNVTYTVLNNLQDFISVKLLWNPDNKEEKKEDVNTSCMDAITNSVICHEPYSSTGYCQTGSTLTFNVGFQALNPGVFEIGQHMKLKLQYTAPLSTNASPLIDSKMRSRKGLHPDTATYGSPYLERKIPYSSHRSHSISNDPYHTQSAAMVRSHFYSPGIRSSGSTYSLPARYESPTPSPTDTPNKRNPLATGPTKLSLDRIIKRRCQVYVMA